MLLVNSLEEVGVNFEWLLDSKTIGELQEKCSSIIVSQEDERNHASITSFSPAGELPDVSFSKCSASLSCQGFIFDKEKNTLVRLSGGKGDSSGDERFAELLVEEVKGVWRGE